MLFLAPFLLAAPLPAGEPVDLELRFRRHRDWDLLVPGERFHPVGDAFRFPAAAFAARVEGTRLRVDLDADGALDAWVDAPESPERTASVLLRDPASGFRYALRLRFEPEAGWSWTAGFVRSAQVGSTPVAFLDADADGRFGEVGEDAVLVGRGHIAAPLGETLVVEGVLWRLQVTEDGNRARLEPWEGPAGVLDLREGLQAEARLLSAVVRSADGRHVLDLAAGPAPVPAGEWRFQEAWLAQGPLEVQVGRGHAAPLRVEDGGRTVWEWGGPVQAAFRYQRSGGLLSFSPDAILYFGRAGEQYLRWWPAGRSPVFVVSRRDTGEELARAVFPGST